MILSQFHPSDGQSFLEARGGFMHQILFVIVNSNQVVGVARLQRVLKVKLLNQLNVLHVSSFTLLLVAHCAVKAGYDPVGLKHPTVLREIDSVKRTFFLKVFRGLTVTSNIFVAASFSLNNRQIALDFANIEVLRLTE